MLHAGTARKDMTPPVGIAHTLWGARTRETADGIHLPLSATALCLASGETRLLLVDVDLTGLPSRVSLAMREDVAAATGIPVEAISISTTHTHSTPVWDAESTNGASPELPGMNLMPAWRQKVQDAVRDAARDAVAALRPARFAHGATRSEVSVNRRFVTPDGRLIVGFNADGVSDATVNLMRFDDLDGRTIACVVGYGTHPIVLAHQNSSISADYPGALKQTVEAVMGGHCLFLQACAGDQIPYEALTGELAAAERIGRHLGADATSGLAALKPENRRASYAGVVESGAPLARLDHETLADNPAGLAVRTRVVRLPVRGFAPIGELQARAAATRDEFLAMRSRDHDPERYAEVHFRARRADIMLTMALRAQGVTSVPIEIRAVAVGDCAVVSAPMELFAETGMLIRAASPFATTFVGGYTNGTEGYLPMAHSYDEGGYEVELACYVSSQAEAIFRAAALDLLSELAGDVRGLP